MRAWLRPLPFAILGAYLISRGSRAPIDDAAPNRSAALCAALAHDGVTCAAGDDAVAWLDPPTGAVGAAFGKETRALVRARAPAPADATGDPSAAPAEASLDLFLVKVRLSPEGHLLDVGERHDLTPTANADEGAPLVRGPLVAFIVSIDGQPEAVHVLDLRGHDAHAYDELTGGQKAQVKIGDWQATGLARGVKRTAFPLVPPPKKASLSFRPDGMLVVDAGGKPLVIDPEKATIVEGHAQARVTPEGMIAKPPTFAPWMSDRLRAVSWFGDEKNQVLKVIAFTAIEYFKGAKSKLTGDHGEKDAANDMASLTQNTGGGKVEAANFTDPEIGWPPKALDPYLKPPMANEGQWVALEKDGFITPIPGVPAPFVTTFVRGDPAAPHTRVYVTLWDPRLVALHMVAGTVEPVSATGEAGPGLIPRTPEVMRHVVAGFNGGFQATHGEFGMQADGVLYLPPKPYGATVIEMRDGTTAFGAWPKTQDVPEDILSYRQNMTPLVQNDKYNPWGRAWWGGVPPGWHDAIHTTRSGLCITKESFVAYFYGNDIGPEPLGRAMLAARCAFGIHLDMNPGLAGFEFYNMQHTSSFQPLGRPLQNDWEYEGSLKDMPDFKFRARRMVKSMGHMLFPRYIHRDARDFFYLTARTVLPGLPLEGGDAGQWRVKGLPQHGYPYAIALAATKAGERRVRVVRIDPRTVKPRVEEQPSDPQKKDDVVMLFGRAPRAVVPTKARGDAGAPAATAHVPGAKKLVHAKSLFAIAKAEDASPALVDLLAAPSADARAAVGIADEDGVLHWIELLPEEKPDMATSEAMLALLAKLGCTQRALVAGDVRAYPGGSLDAGGEQLTTAVAGSRLLRVKAPGAKVLFDTDPVPQSVWQPLQSQKVKWRPTLAPPDKPAASGSAAPGTPPK